MPRRKEVRTVKVLVIDVVRQEVTVQDWNPNDMNQIYKWVGTSGLDHAMGPTHRGRHVLIWVDDVGMYTNKMRWICPTIYAGGPLVGNAVVLGIDNEGETVDVPLSADNLSIGFECPLAIMGTAGGMH